MTSRSDLPPSDHPPAWYQAILPVIDIRHGQVMRGVAGRRDEYQPIESRYAPDARPGTIAMVYAQTFGFTDCYVADLEAICEGRVEVACLESIAVQGLDIWLDAGVGDVPQWHACLQGLREWQPRWWVVGLESLVSWDALAKLLEVIGPDRLVFSLDLKRGQPVSARSDFRDATPVEIAHKAHSLGVRSILLLDLAAVGEGEGSRTNVLLKQLSAELPQVEWVAGGGMDSPQAVEDLSGLGANRVLVASALHDGRIAPMA